MFPSACAKDDSVAIFNGRLVPYILRRAGGDDRYRFIGECYVDQMMDGQAMELAAVEGIAARKLVII